jgi:signal transduction histidine kinase
VANASTFRKTSSIPLEKTTLARFGWLIALRWIFMVFIILGGLIAGHTFIPELCVKAFVLTGLALGILNIILQIVYQRITAFEHRRKLDYFTVMIQLQVVCDWLALLTLIHFTGGVESPLNHFYIFHLALSAIFLTPIFSVFALIFISAATTGLFILEYYNVLEAVIIEGLTWPGKQHSLVYILNYSFWNFSTLAMLVLLISSVIKGLRRREKSALQNRKRLEQANKQIEAISAERIKLMHIMGHELRSPIAASISMLDAVSLSLGTRLPPEAKKINARVKIRLSSLTTLISELLDLAEQRRDKSRGRPAKVNICKMLETMVLEHQSQAAELKINIFRKCKAAGDIRVYFDEHQLDRVFENLLSNAIKYSRTGGEVSIQSREEDEWVMIEFRDQGIGIAPDQLPKLFDEFYRTPQSRKHTKNGTGLGLAITKEMVETAGGTIIVTSELGVGTCFTVRIPLASE